MRKTIPKFAITAVALLALPSVYGTNPSQAFHRLTQHGNWSIAKKLLDRRVHTTARKAIDTTFMQVGTEGKQETVIPANVPRDIIREISEFTVGLTSREKIEKVLKSVFKKNANASSTPGQPDSDKIAGKIAKEITTFAYGPAMEFSIDPLGASWLLPIMVS